MFCVIPGFELAITANNIFKNNKVIGLILLNHGIFSLVPLQNRAMIEDRISNIGEKFSKYPNKMLKNSKKKI